MSPSASLVLLTGFVVLLFNSGVRFSIGLVLKPMADDLDWSRTALSVAVTVFMVLSALALPFAGRLVDRFGTGLVLSVSVLLMSAGTAAMSVVETPWQALVFYGVVVAIGSAGTSIAPIGVLVSRWFPDRIGLANSVAISGMGVGQLSIILVLSAYLDVLGWRGAFVALAVANVVFVLPLVLFTAVRTPRSTRPATLKAAPDDGETELLVVARSRYFWWLLGLYAICGFHDFFMATHIVAFGLDEGLGERLSGSMFAFMGLAGLLGVLLTGLVADRYGPVLPTLGCFVLRVVLFAGIAWTREPLFIVAFALLFGATFWITAPLTVVFVKQRFGSALLGTVSGTVTMVHHIAGGIGAIVGAVVFDAFGSYDLVYWLALMLSVLAIAVTRPLTFQRSP